MTYNISSKTIHAPIIVMAFNRPLYLHRVLTSLRNQRGVDLSKHQITLFQDGAVSIHSGKRHADDSDIDENCRLFAELFPTGRIERSEQNLGVALNFERAEKYAFEVLRSPFAIFLEDDLELGPFYISTMLKLGGLAMERKEVGYFAAYGDHRASLETQLKHPNSIRPMEHNWAFGLTRSQWLRSKPYVDQYLELVRNLDYRDRPHEKIYGLMKSWGCGAPASSQDTAKGLACYLTGGIRINTTPAFGKYIGEAGLHSTPKFYAEQRFGLTEVTESDVFNKTTIDQSEIDSIKNYAIHQVMSYHPSIKHRGMIYYDISDLMQFAPHHTTLSGIQRFTVQALTHFVNKYGAKNVRVIAFHPRWRKIVWFDADYFAGAYRFDQDDFCRRFGLRDEGHRTFTQYLAEQYSGRAQRRWHRARLMLANNLDRGQTFSKLRIKRAVDVFMRPPHGDALLDLAPGDIVFVSGATWNFDEYLASLASLRKTRAIRLYQFIHDLIPLLAPEHVVGDVPGHFLRWLKTLSQNVDRFIANSNATKSDLDAWLAENGCKVATSVVPLAHQFCDIPRGELHMVGSRHNVGGRDPIRVHVRNAARLPYALCVGTMESRKNVFTLAHAWRRVFEKLGGSTPRLLFAGAHGWLKEDFDDFIKGTGSLYGVIRIVERPTDAELAFLYRMCMFTIFPSYKEGWGLPIGESLWFGRPVIASNTSSMPEVGGDLADYVDPNSPQSIEDAVLRMITDPLYREQRASAIAAADLRSWRDVADDLWSVLTESDGKLPMNVSNREGVMRWNGAALRAAAEKVSIETLRRPRLQPNFRWRRLGRILPFNGALRLLRADTADQPIRWEILRPEDCEFRYPDDEGPSRSNATALD